MHIRELIAQDRIQEAIEALLKEFEDSTMENQIINLSGRLKQINTLRYEGTLSINDYFLEVNKIRYGLLEMCDGLKIFKTPSLLDRKHGELVSILENRAERILKLFDLIELKNKNSSKLRIENTESIPKARKLFKSLHQKHINALKANSLILAYELAQDIHFLLFEVASSNFSMRGAAYYSLPKLFVLLNELYIENFDTKKEKETGKLEILINDEFKQTWSYLDEPEENPDLQKQKFNEARWQRINALIN